MSAKGTSQFGRHPASAIDSSRSFPSAWRTVPRGSLAFSARTLVETLSRCQKPEWAESSPTDSLAITQQPISLVRSLIGRHPANPFCANAGSLIASGSTPQTEMASTQTRGWCLPIHLANRFTFTPIDSFVGLPGHATSVAIVPLRPSVMTEISWISWGRGNEYRPSWLGIASEYMCLRRWQKLSFEEPLRIQCLLRRVNRRVFRRHRVHKRASGRPMDNLPETGLGEINGDLREADFWTIFRGGGLADRLLVRITYGMTIYQRLAALIRVRNSMIGKSSIRKMVHSRRHRQSWGMCTPRHIERRNPERCCQRSTPASDERCCKGTL